MDRENLSFYEYDDGLYTIVDKYLPGGESFGNKDSYNYYDIDVDKILLYKKSAGEYFIRYDDMYNTKIAPSQLKM